MPVAVTSSARPESWIAGAGDVQPVSRYRRARLPPAAQDPHGPVRLRYAVLHDFSVAYKLILSVLVLGAAFAFRQWLDALLVLVVTARVLAAELLNSAVDAVCDFLETRENERIRVI